MTAIAVVKNENEKRQIPRLKVLEREAIRRGFIGDYSLRSGSFSYHHESVKMKRLEH